VRKAVCPVPGATAIAAAAIHIAVVRAMPASSAQCVSTS
jgi:hypothetical protein